MFLIKLNIISAAAGMHLILKGKIVLQVNSTMTISVGSKKFSHVPLFLDYLTQFISTAIWSRAQESGIQSFIYKFVFHGVYYCVLCAISTVLSNSVMSDSETPWIVARQAPQSMKILQARILEFVAMPSSRGPSQPRDWTQVSCTAGRFFKF